MLGVFNIGNSKSGLQKLQPTFTLSNQLKIQTFLINVKDLKNWFARLLLFAF